MAEFEELDAVSVVIDGKRVIGVVVGKALYHGKETEYLVQRRDRQDARRSSEWYLASRLTAA